MFQKKKTNKKKGKKRIRSYDNIKTKREKKKKETCDSNFHDFSRVSKAIQLGSGGSLNRHDTVKYLCDLGLRASVVRNDGRVTIAVKDRRNETSTTVLGCHIPDIDVTRVTGLYPRS